VNYKILIILSTKYMQAIFMTPRLVNCFYKTLVLNCVTESLGEGEGGGGCIIHDETSKLSIGICLVN
jgi:hypothetical protein